MSFVSANGVRFNVQRLGKGGRQVVFLHGLAMDSLSSWYFTVANPVALDSRVLLYDMRGHGLSEQPAEGYTVDDSVADLVEILDAVGVDEPAYFVGNSYGGLVSLALAIDQPERVAGLVLVEAHFASEGWAENTAATLEFAGLGMEDDMVLSILEEHGKRHHSRRFHRADDLLSKTTLIEDMRRSRRFTEAELASVTCPALALYGEESDIIDRGRDLAGMLPHCELRVLDGAVHTILTHHPRWVREQILEWLGSRANGAGGRST